MDAKAARKRIGNAPYFTQIEGESFDGLDLHSVTTNHVRFERCSFIGADLRQATLDNCWFHFCNLTGAVLRGASIRFASIAACDLTDADLRDCDLTGARIGRVNTGTDSGLSRASGVLLANARLTDLELDRVVDWPSA